MALVARSLGLLADR